MGREGMKGESSSFDKFEMVITKAYFATAPSYSADDLFLHFLGTTNIEAQPVYDEDSAYHPSWKVGKAWESLDGGATASSVTEKKFNNSSAIIKALINPAMELVPEGGPDDIFNDAANTDASIWVGTKWQFEDIEYKFKGFKDETTGEDVTADWTTPTAYLGKAEAGAEIPASGNGEGNTGELARLKLTDLAKKTDSFEDFQSQAMDIVSGNDELTELILNDEFWVGANR